MFLSSQHLVGGSEMTVQQLLDALQCANPDAWVELEAEGFWGRVCGGAADIIVEQDTVTISTYPD